MLRWNLRSVDMQHDVFIITIITIFYTPGSIDPRG